MIRDAMEALGGKSTNVAVKDWILKRYPGTNHSTIQCQVIACTVNHPSRIHYPEAKKPRIANGQYDFLFRTERGQLEIYDPTRHGTWRIVESEDGRLRVVQAETEEDVVPPEAETGNAFAAENHLRDYLAQHLDEVEPGLHLYVDDQGTDGIEYATPIGRIDILALDRKEDLVIIELKVGRGPDSVCGQLLRYTGWVKRHLADGKRVRGFIIAQHISDRIRYALADSSDVHLREYDLKLILRDVPDLDPPSSR